MPQYWEVKIDSGLREGNFQIFRTLPLNADRHWDDPSLFHWYLITHQRHRRELLANINRWKVSRLVPFGHVFWPSSFLFFAPSSRVTQITLQENIKNIE
jgi:hypothetical protein